MHLESLKGSRPCASRGGRFEFRAGETIHTENCHKYVVETFAARAATVGWTLEKAWVSRSPEFAVLLLS